MGDAMNYARRIRPQVQYRDRDTGATVWSDSRAWENLPAIGTVLLHDGVPYLVTGAWRFDDERAPIVSVTKKSGSGTRRAIRLDEV